jgi:hypothetical protein
MPKLSDIHIDAARFKGRGLRPWTDNNGEVKAEATPKKTEARIEPNQSQTEVVIEPKPKPNQSQTEARIIFANSTKAKIEPKSEPNQSHFRAKSEPDNSFLQLAKLQKRVLLFIYNTCKISRNKCTPPLGIENIVYGCGNTTVAAIKKAIQRLELHNFIFRIKHKKGRGGWTIYEISNPIYQEMLSLETGVKIESNWSHIEAILGTELEPSASSSSSFNNLNTTTTGTEEFKIQKIDLSEDWLNIDIEPLKDIGFTKTHLEQIASQNLLLPEIVQNSIYAFSFDLVENNKEKELKGQPINFFMGILRKGNPYASPANYESPKDKAMRVYAERQRTIKEKRAAMEKEIFEHAFNEWYSNISEEERRVFASKNIEYKRDSKFVETNARTHFKNNIWLEELNKIQNT